MMAVFGLIREARFYTCDPMHRLEEAAFSATDELVATGRIGVVGVNYYPHHASVPLAEVLRAAWQRYSLPLAIMETSWHIGHPKARRRFRFIDDSQVAWLAHVHAEVAASGVPVEGICWYPFLDQPVWGKPGTRDRWPCGYGSGQALAAALPIERPVNAATASASAGSARRSAANGEQASRPLAQ
jgi:hypothetical protein